MTLNNILQTPRSQTSFSVVSKPSSLRSSSEFLRKDLRNLLVTGLMKRKRLMKTYFRRVFLFFHQLCNSHDKNSHFTPSLLRLLFLTLHPSFHDPPTATPPRWLPTSTLGTFTDVSTPPPHEKQDDRSADNARQVQVLHVAVCQCTRTHTHAKHCCFAKDPKQYFVPESGMVADEGERQNG